MSIWNWSSLFARNLTNVIMNSTHAFYIWFCDLKYLQHYNFLLLILKIFEATFGTKGWTIFPNMLLTSIHGIRPCHEWGFLTFIWVFLFCCKIMWLVCHVDHYIGGSYVVLQRWFTNLALTNVHFWQITSGNHIVFMFSPH